MSNPVIIIIMSMVEYYVCYQYLYSYWLLQLLLSYRLFTFAFSQFVNFNTLK